MPLPSPRPDPVSQLLDAIRRRDPAATARLTRRWAHRRGVSSLEEFRCSSVIPLEGQDGGDWLLQQLDGSAPVPSATAPCSPQASAAQNVPEVPVGTAVEDGFTGLETAFLPSPLNPSTEAPCPAEAADGSTLSALALLSAAPPGTLPAPAPSTLADLRSWLSGAPQHRRAG